MPEFQLQGLGGCGERGETEIDIREFQQRKFCTSGTFGHMLSCARQALCTKKAGPSPSRVSRGTWTLLPRGADSSIKSQLQHSVLNGRRGGIMGSTASINPTENIRVPNTEEKDPTLTQGRQSVNWVTVLGCCFGSARPVQGRGRSELGRRPSLHSGARRDDCSLGRAKPPYVEK